MSTHVVPVIEVKEVIPHPNADRLDLIPVGGWQCAVQKGSFKVGDLAVYVEPDFMVPVTRPEFAFLKDPNKFDQTHARIKGRRLRGCMSFGLLIEAPERVSLDSVLGPDTVKTEVGMNLLDFYGIHRWEPPMVGRNFGQGMQIEEKFNPPIPGSERKFDLENINNYPHVLDYVNTPVVITEKIHGANARYLFLNGTFYVGSRGRWLRRPNEEDIANGNKLDAWHKAADEQPAIEEWCRENEGTILYGEIFGNVQDLKYGRPNTVEFAAFAAYDGVTGQWRQTTTLLHDLKGFGILTVPVLSVGPISKDSLLDLLEEDSTVPGVPKGHMREGVVITPLDEQRHPDIGRVSLKLISNRYWERKL